MGVVFDFLVGFVAEVVFLRVWSGNCAIVGAKMGIWDLDVELARQSVGCLECYRCEMSYCEIACPPQWDDGNSLFLTNLPVPPVYPALQIVQLLLHARQAYILPQPEGRYAHDGI